MVTRVTGSIKFFSHYFQQNLLFASEKRAFSLCNHEIHQKTYFVANQRIRNLSMFNQKALHSYNITVNNQEITPWHADACGNTFLIYDLIKHNLKKEQWNHVKTAIWNHLRTALVDDALVLEPVKNNKSILQVAMHVLEPDATQADFCGNGARSVGDYLIRKYKEESQQIELISRKGIHSVLMRDDVCFIDMGIPEMESTPHYFLFEGKKYAFYFVDVSERHLVTFDVPDNCTELLTKIGHALNKEWKKTFPQGINLNAVHIPEFGGNRLKVSTFERGVYRITQSCGTGSTGSCQVSLKNLRLNQFNSSYQIETPGGTLQVYRNHDDHFWLGGNVILKSANKAQ